jgi:hypothetical protein
MFPIPWQQFGKPALWDVGDAAEYVGEPSQRIDVIELKCEGRKSYAERDPALVLAAKRLHRRSPKGHRRSLREIASELAVIGYTNKRGAPYSASCVKSMVEGPTPSAIAQAAT